MKKIYSLAILCGIFCGIQFASAQGFPPRDMQIERKRREMDKINGRDENGMIADRPGGKFPQRPRTKPDGKPYTKEELEQIRALLEPNAEDAAKYKDFLRQPKTGLFRLFPDYDCESKDTIRVDANCENSILGGWSYSFRRKNHPGLDFFDIRLNDGNLIADGFLAQGILVSLGDAALESVSAASGGIKFLSDFKPERQSREAKKQFAQIAQAIESGGYKYSKSAKALENTTYALRVVAYRSQQRITNRFKEGVDRDTIRYIMTLDGDKRMDLTVAFRIVRRDEDGSITILWKELSRRNSPEIVFQKDERLSDIKTGE